MLQQEIVRLFQLLMASKATQQEQEILRSLLALPENKEIAQQLIDTAYANSRSCVDISVDTRQAMLNAIFESTTPDQALNTSPVAKQKTNYKLYLKLAAAAILLATLAVNFYIHRPIAEMKDIAPGTNQATLTLSDGRTIRLDSTKKGLILNGENIKYDDGNTLYAGTPEDSGTLNRNLIITTPKGGQYQIMLSDGTRVWLNAESSLTYPLHFDDTERVVRLTGEGYFEVTKNRSVPFIVMSRDQRVKVLGTSFNVTAYGDEAITKTTLVEGKVEVSLLENDRRQSAMLLPGNQAVLRQNTINVAKVDVFAETAWKDGRFYFHHAELRDVMRDICRWYNVEVDYNTLPPEKFNGYLKRDIMLSELLRTFEVTSNIKFKLEGRRLRRID
jgi:transmembrane sensor